MTIKPVEIKRLGTDSLCITWSDGIKQELKSEILRENCPCAACKETRGEINHERPLEKPKGAKRSLMIVEHSVDESHRLEKIWPIGNYALGIAWGDGHQTGIYTYQLLKTLGDFVENRTGDPTETRLEDKASSK